MSQGFISRRGGVGGGDSNTAFKAFVSGTLTNITADMIANCTVIGDYTFYHCAILQTVSIPESVTTIGEHALITVEHLSNQRFTNFYPKEYYLNMSCY